MSTWKWRSELSRARNEILDQIKLLEEKNHPSSEKKTMLRLTSFLFFCNYGMILKFGAERPLLFVHTKMFKRNVLCEDDVCVRCKITNYTLSLTGEQIYYGIMSSQTMFQLQKLRLPYLQRLQRCLATGLISYVFLGVPVLQHHRLRRREFK